MVRIICDACGRIKPSTDTRVGDDDWLLGYDLQMENPNALQRSLRFLSRWDDTRIVELGAIHLCSQECKEKYIRKARSAA